MASFALAAPAPVRAATRSVTNCLDDNSAGSLRQVLNGATNGDTITFAQDCNSGAAPNMGIKLTSTLTLGATVAIDGTGHNVTISGGNTVQLFVLNGGTGVTLSLTGLTLANGKSSGGGAVENLGTLRVTRCTFRNNAATNGNGGAIFNFGNTTVTSSTFTSNASSGADINGINSGGAIFNSLGTTTVTGSVFSSNTGQYGGAIYNNSGTVQVTNNSFYANTATGNGGAIDNGATMNVTGSTFSGNSAPNGGGIYSETDGSITLGLSVVANNTAPTGPDLNLSFGDFGGNVISKIDGSTGISNGVNNNRTGTSAAPLDAKLGPLANNGGPTQTFALLPGSPAIDIRACSSGLTTDQRGVSRPQGAACDSGSYEGIVSPHTFVVTRAADDANDANCNDAANGGCTLRQAVRQSNLTTGTGTNTITFDATAFAAAQTITLSATLAPTTNVTIDGTAYHVTISGNSSVQLFNVGGGVTLSLKALTLASGRATLPTCGGAINNSGTVNVSGSAFIGNTASGSNNEGGAICNSGTVNATGNAFVSNSASYGGAIFNVGTVKVTGSTFVSNSAPNGGAIDNNGSTFTLALSVVAGGSGSDLYGTITSGGGNVIGKTDGATFIAQPTDKTGTAAAPLDAKLASFGSYGGPTQTFALLPGSPAIDRAPCPIDPITTATLGTDARGVTRPQGAACDSGSFESQGFTLTSPTGNNQSATVTTNFAAPLTLTVGSSHSEPITGGTLTFTITPGAGDASAAFIGTTSCTVSVDHLTAVCPVTGSSLVTAPTIKAGLNVGNVTVIASSAGVPTAGNVTYTLTNTSSAGLITPQPNRAPAGTVAAGAPAPQPMPKATATGAPAGTIIPQPTRH